MRIARSICLAILLLSSFVDAQQDTGRIVGTVRDADGFVPGAIVTATNSVNAFRTQYLGKTDASGQFQIGGLPQGTYRVEAHTGGFRGIVLTSVQVVAGAEVRCALVLQPGIVTDVLYPWTLREAVQRRDGTKTEAAASRNSVASIATGT